LIHKAEKMQKALVLALLLTGLFLSFFASSEGEYFDTRDPKPAKDGLLVCLSAARPNIGGTKQYGCDSSASSAFSKALNAYLGDKNGAPNLCTGACLTASYAVATQSPPTSATFTLNYTEKINIKPDGSYDTHSGSASGGFVNFSQEQTTGLVCDYPEHTIGPLTYNGIANQCFKPKPVMDCPTEANGNLMFHVGQKGGGSACVTMDNGSICPFTESSTAGYYTPNYGDPQACAIKDGEDPNAKDDCSPNGAGQLVCKADPSEKCTASNGFLQCEEGCGYLNDVFMCFPDPEEPDEPDEPDVPDPTPDDDITDPNKPMADMVKSDFKDVMKGVETRLNSTKKELEDVQKNNDKNTKSLNEALKGLGSKIDKTNNKLDGIQDTLDDTLYGEELDDSGLNDDAAMKAGLGITGNEQLSDLKFADVDIDSFRSQFAPFLNTSQCPAPRSITIKGNSYSLDWAPFCEFFAALSYLVLAAAYLLVPFIVFGGKK
jgi:hypothetical protein